MKSFAMTSLLTSLMLACLAGALPAQRQTDVLVYAEGYRYGKAACELAEKLDRDTTDNITAVFSNSQQILQPQSLAGFDVLVLFNHNDLKAVHEKAISKFVHGGRGLVALHHVINEANDNPELNRLIGGYYSVEDGMVEHRDFHIEKIAGKSHPVLEGIPERILIKNDQDFRMRFFNGQEVNRLLTCEITDNGEQEDCGWTRTPGAGRVVFLSPGDPVEEKPFLRNEPLYRLIENAVRWAGGDL